MHESIERDLATERAADDRELAAREVVAAKRRAAQESALKEAARKARLAEAAIKARPGAKLGMTPREVIEATNWGRPQTVNRTVNAAGAREQWVYPDFQYLFFENDRLVEIRTRGP